MFRSCRKAETGRNAPKARSGSDRGHSSPRQDRNIDTDHNGAPARQPPWVTPSRIRVPNRGASDNKTSSSLQPTYAFRRGGALQGHAVLSAGTQARSDGIFGETRSQRGDELDYQKPFPKLMDEMSCRFGV